MRRRQARACALRLRTLVLFMSVFLVLACGSETIPATSPPQAAATPATAILESTATPQPTHSPTTQPPAAGARLFEGDKQHLINPSAAAEARLAIDQMLEGDYEAALEHLLKAKALEGSPSSVLEAYTGIVYGRMGQNDLAVNHHSRAIAIEDSTSNRMNRAGAYRRNGQCGKTIEDAQSGSGVPAGGTRRCPSCRTGKTSADGVLHHTGTRRLGPGTRHRRCEIGRETRI